MEATNLGDFIFIYEKFAAAENQSRRTIEGVTTAVRQFDHFLGGCTDVRQVGAEDLRRYIRMLQEKNRWSGHPTIKSRDDKLSPHSMQRILGHSTLEMTRHYTEVSDSDIETKQKAFSPAEKLALTI